MAVVTALLALLFVSANAAKNTISFTEIAAPTEAQYTYKGFTDVVVNGRALKVKYTPLFESGKKYPSFTAGKMYSIGTPKDIYGVDITVNDSAIADPKLVRDFDRTSLFKKYGKFWAISQNEDAFGSYFLFQLTQSSSGALTVVKGKTLTPNTIRGSIRPCSGYLTPWLSHLGGEEDVVDAKTYPPSSTVSQFVAQAIVHRLSKWSDVNPYWYGYVVEAAVTSAAGAATLTKRYALGRVSHETAVVLGDKRTVITTDDASSGGVIVLFVADKAGDLSSGKLFAALPVQLNAADGGSFKLKWIALNPTGESVHEKTIAAAVSGRTYAAAPVKFKNLFDVATVVYDANGNPDLTKLPPGYKVCKSGASTYEWLKLKTGMGGLASCMETKRMAAYVGASNEFTKAEGVTYDAKTNVAYLALTSIRRAMLDKNGKDDVGGPNAIRLPENYAGAVYKLTLGTIAGVSSYAPTYMRAIINGYGYNGNDSAPNSVPAGSIASPDNIGIMSAYNKILISEDCDVQHVNNFLWAYDLVTGEIDRLFYSPFEAEVTSGYYFPNLGKFSYLTASVQHPRPEVPSTMGYWTLPYEKV